MEETKVPKWLKHLQENSWEAEILISGGAIFSLVQLTDWISGFVVRLKEVSAITGTNIILVCSHVCINSILIGFIAHLVLRSFWIALICLRYAFPQGINFNRLKIEGSYLTEAQSVNLTGQIFKLDHLSGLLFFCSIAFALFIVGMVLCLIPFGLIYSMSEKFKDAAVALYLIFGLLFAFDLLLSGILRKNKFLGLVYRPFYLFFNTISLAFIYRPWLQTLFTNVIKWKFFLAGLLFIISTLALTAMTVRRPLNFRSILDTRKFWIDYETTKLWSDGFYENTYPEETIVSFACIQKDIVDDDYLKLFIPYKAIYDNQIDKTHSKSLADLFTIKLNDAVITNLDWLWGNHFSTNQTGITTYIAIDHLAKGKHTLTIEMKNGEWPFPLTIPFWKQ